MDYNQLNYKIRCLNKWRDDGNDYYKRIMLNIKRNKNSSINRIIPQLISIM